MNDPSPESALTFLLDRLEHAYSTYTLSGALDRDCHTFIRTHGAHFAALAARLEDVKAECQLRGDALVVEMSRSERAEAERDAAARDARAWRNRFIDERMNAYASEGYEMRRASAESDANDFEQAFHAAMGKGEGK